MTHLSHHAVNVTIDPNSFPRYDPSQSFVGWAFGIARNQVRLHFRRWGRERIAFDTETVDAIAVAFADQPQRDPRLDHMSECFEDLGDRAKKLCRLR